jgi:protein involved in polysaccharide export with SLBB domain
MSDKASTTLPAMVEKIIDSPAPNQPEKAQISVEGADHLYRELRIENTLIAENGQTVRLKPGDEVEVTIAAEKSSGAAAEGNDRTA